MTRRIFMDLDDCLLKTDAQLIWIDPVSGLEHRSMDPPDPTPEMVEQNKKYIMNPREFEEVARLPSAIFNPDMLSILHALAVESVVDDEVKIGFLTARGSGSAENNENAYYEVLSTLLKPLGIALDRETCCGISDIKYSGLLASREQEDNPTGKGGCSPLCVAKRKREWIQQFVDRGDFCVYLDDSELNIRGVVEGILVNKRSGEEKVIGAPLANTVGEQVEWIGGGKVADYRDIYDQGKHKLIYSGYDLSVKRYQTAEDALGQWTSDWRRPTNFGAWTASFAKPVAGYDPFYRYQREETSNWSIPRSATTSEQDAKDFGYRIHGLQEGVIYEVYPRYVTDLTWLNPGQKEHLIRGSKWKQIGKPYFDGRYKHVKITDF